MEVVTVDPSVQAGLRQFVDEMEPGGAVWVGPLEGNGGREVLVYVPPGADDSAPFELVYHFHGTYSERVQKRDDRMKKKREWVGWDRLGQTLAAAAELQDARDYNVALVYPISAGKRLEPGHTGWSNVAYDRMWMDPAQPPDFRDDFDRLHGEVVDLLVDSFGVHPSKLPATVLVEGHSAGGMALRNIAVRGTDRVGEYLFLDASFMGWADVAHEALVEAGSSAQLTMVITTKGMCDPFDGRDPWCVTLEEHAASFEANERTCADKGGDHEPRGADVDCETLELDAESWRDLEGWCDDMADEMRNVPNVALVRTHVYHADHPRRFSGGLGLPDDRGAAALSNEP